MKATDLSFDAQHIWHPYTSVINPIPTYPVKSAHDVSLEFEDGTSVIDGMSSWWSVIHGYNHPVINKAIKDQVDRVSHVMFGGLTHQPAIDLCRTLVDISPNGLDYVFLADSGSVSVEVALKMALQYWQSTGNTKKNRMLTIQHGYHGDTFGAMSVCDPINSMHSLYADLLPRHLFAQAPQTGFDAQWQPEDIEPLKAQLEMHHQQIAAIILEPIVQGAGGMRIYHPEYLRQCRQLCDDYNVLLICDEIATGFGRTGKLFACEHAQISPDIICVGKALTGGYLSLAATLCNKKVAQGIGHGSAGVLMHGPTFMGNPLACAAANASLSLLLNAQWQTRVENIESQLRTELMPLTTLAHVADVRVLGAIGVVEMQQPVDVAKIQRRFIELGVWIRPFGKLIYIMPPYVITPDALHRVTRAITTAVTENTYGI